MNLIYVLSAIAVGAFVTLLLRSLPFLAFRKGQVPQWLHSLGQILPSAIMAVLVVYCLKGVKDDPSGIGIPSLLGVLVVGVSYKCRHNTFWSILLGTATYMALLRML